jgi:hypothetical protein
MLQNNNHLEKQGIRGKNILLETIQVLEWLKLLKRGKYNSKFLSPRFLNSQLAKALILFLAKALQIKHPKFMEV